MKPLTKILKLFLFLLLSGNLPVRGDITLPAVLGSNMVLQQNSEVKIWGWADKGENISISPGWLTKVYNTTAGADGKWMIEIETMGAGGPHSLKFEGKNVILLENIMFGEVWICSGQSNMEYTLSRTGGWDHEMYRTDREEFKDNDYSSIRYFKVEQDNSPVPLDNCKGQWEVSDPEKVDGFSAVAWFFGLEVYKKISVPVGLISTNWGGSKAEAWTSLDVLKRNPDLASYADIQTDRPNKTPGALYHAMLHPLLNYSIKGVIWYQGEANTNNALHYQKLFPEMIRSWREDFRQGDFPFYYVQLAPYNYKQATNNGTLLREAQLMTLSTARNTGMAVTLDIGANRDIHPKNKRDVGKRLALIAIANTYGFSDCIYSGPVFTRMEITDLSDNPSGKEARLYFNNAHGKLVISGGEPDNFIIAGPDKNFLPAQVRIEEETILLWNDSIREPVAVRYAFSDTASASLFNGEGLPASSFRTDNWPVLTDQTE